MHPQCGEVSPNTKGNSLECLGLESTIEHLEWKIASKLLIWVPPVDDAMIEINNVLPHQINV
jgi:hypothetical protein